MKKNVFNIAVMAFVAATMLASCGGNGKQEQAKASLSGAGATFPEPYYTMIFKSYNTKTGNQVSYGGIGSGGGVRNLKDEIVDFAGSDAFLTDEEMAEMKPVVHVPTCMGAVVLAYNLPEVKELRLNGEVVCDIFAGKITKWNDSRIAALNPQAKLPAKDIIPVFRSDGSGTTSVFTSYLSAVSADWKARYGAGKSVNFPVGQAAKGNPGVAGVISQTNGAIGYVGSEYAFAQKIPMAVMQNASGKFVQPTPENISAAASGDMPADTRKMIVNSDARDAYPIACFTWILIYQEQNYSNRTEEQARATLDLLQFILSNEAQQMTTAVNYCPLPKSLVKQSLDNLKTVTYNGKPLLN
ncbi:MAG: phosphate ABC transporter substrate-binding protein PstS [Bacteroidales bacterium]|nr:phosphate ABC transporter substrate-binding protein PstS [Bacteroidales bacterium]